MTDTINQEAVVDRDQEARKLFGFAVALDPAKLFDDLRQPRVHELPGAARDHLITEYNGLKKQQSELGYLVLHGIGQVTTYLTEILALHPEISMDQALAIARNKRTAAGLALIAKQTSRMSGKMLERPSEVYHLSNDGEAIEVDPSVFTSQHAGCPAIEIVGDSLEPWPIFNRFAPWAGELAVHSFYEHPIKR